MKRELNQLANTTYDVLVVGAGIHGAFMAWDAALRGLHVALIDRGDFGNATSANSLKTVHGGLRYLQDADVKLVRKMIKERMTLLRIAPHLVHPLPCIMPTYPNLVRSRLAMTVALALNDLVGFDRNRGADPQKLLPRGRVVSREECLRLLPGIADEGITGGAIWYDGQMYNSERLLLAVVQSAVDTGASVANYVEASSFLVQGNRVAGVRASDRLTGHQFDIQAKLVVNAAGPWAYQLLNRLNDRRPQAPKFKLSTAMNVVTRQIIPGYAAGVPSRYEVENGRAIIAKKPHVLFIAPWRDYSIVGTIHRPFDGHPDGDLVTEADIQHFVDEINLAYPGAQLQREDVRFVHRGLLPAVDGASAKHVKLLREGQVYDHRAEDGLDGLLSVVGVKYTSARSVAQHAVDLAFRKLGQEPPACRTATTQMHGGQIERFGDFLAQAKLRHADMLKGTVVQHLVYNYGTQYSRLLDCAREAPTWDEPACGAADVLKVEVVHAVREEMAQKLSDVILRRTELGSAGRPGEECLRACAELMAAELGWDETRVQQELDETRALFALKGKRHVSPVTASMEVV